jgi:hypothetical protein
MGYSAPRLAHHGARVRLRLSGLDDQTLTPILTDKAVCGVSADPDDVCHVSLCVALET